MVGVLEESGKVDLGLVRRRIPMGRLARGDEIAAAIGFLASPEARYVTGSVLVVDGGWMSFNQPGDAHPPVDGVPEAELTRPEAAKTRRNVLVTGAAKGIGAAIAARFAAEGERVILADRDATALNETAAALGGDHIAIEMDLAEDASIAAAFARIAAEAGGIDVLVNNAAIADTFKPVAEQTAADLERVLEINLAGAFSCTREALKLMPEGGARSSTSAPSTPSCPSPRAMPTAHPRPPSTC
jgi:NAD(P)-dependent dehydrogenase (short-subunit alcohol dehydrogenase family)